MLFAKRSKMFKKQIKVYSNLKKGLIVKYENNKKWNFY